MGLGIAIGERWGLASSQERTASGQRAAIGDQQANIDQQSASS